MTKKSIFNPKFSSSIVQQLDVLAERRKDWEATDYKKANEGLYALLAECLSIYQDRFVKGTEEEQKVLRIELILRLTNDGIRVVKTSTTLTMLARYVFNSDRKRAHGYSYVLAAAVSHKVQAADFAAWVVEQGGIEEIKRLMVKTPETIAKQQAVAAATVAVKGEIELNAVQPLAHVGINGLGGNYAVLLVKPNVEGGADVIGTLSDINDAMVNALVLRMAKQQVEQDAANKEMAQQIKNEKAGGMFAGVSEPQLNVANG